MVSGGELRAPQFNGLWDTVYSNSPSKAPNEGDSGETSGSKVKKTESETKEERIKDAKALCIIQGALTNDIFSIIRNEKTARGAWDLLRREYRGDEKVKEVKMQVVRVEFEYMRMSEGENLDHYLTKFFGVINDLKFLGEEISEQRIVKRIVKEVLLVSDLDENLLSVGQMMEHGYYILFGGNKAIIFDDEKIKNIIAKVIMRGNRCFPLTLESMLLAARKATVTENSWIWHRRLGHLNFESLKKMQQLELVAGLPRLTNVNTVFEGCILGKHKRQAFNKEGAWRASQPLELVHTNICGPMQAD